MARSRKRERSVLVEAPSPPVVVSTRLAVCTLILLAVVPYLNSLSGSFHFDDHPQILWNQHLDDLGGTLSGRPVARRLTHLSYYINHQLHGLDFMPGWHAVNIALHAGCVLAAYWALRLLAKAGDVPPALPFFGAALFAVHPLASEPVNYIQARSVLMVTAFSLLSLCGAMVIHRAKARSGGAWGGALLLASAVLAALSKEVGIVFAAGLPVLYVLFVMSGEVANRKRFWRWTGGALAGGVGAGVTWVLATGLGPHVARRFEMMSFWPHLWGQTLVFWRYIGLMLFPAPSQLNFDHYVLYPKTMQYSPGQGGVLAASLAILLLVALAVVLKRWWRTAALLMAVILLGLAPYFVLASMEVMVEYRCYPSLFAFCGLAGLALCRLERKHRMAGFGALAGLCVVLGGCTMVRNTVWRNDITLWTDAAAKSPRKARAVNNLGRAYALSETDRDPKRAVELTRRSLNEKQGLDPWPGFNQHMVDSLAQAYYAAGMYAQAYTVESRLVDLMEKKKIYAGIKFFREQRDKFKAAWDKARSE
jgi:protein O-mannosyl-transferase